MGEARQGLESWRGGREGLYVMVTEDGRAVILTDPTVNIDPSAANPADIAEEAVETTLVGSASGCRAVHHVDRLWCSSVLVAPELQTTRPTRCVSLRPPHVRPDALLDSGYNHNMPAELKALTTAECISLLLQAHVGRVAFLSLDGTMHVIPLNYAADHEGRVVFRTAWTTLLTEIPLQSVAFETDKFDEAGRTGWSVCVHGVAREITDADDPAAEALKGLGVDTWAPGERSVWLAIIPLEITGRRLRFNPLAADGGWWLGGGMAEF